MLTLLSGQTQQLPHTHTHTHTHTHPACSVLMGQHDEPLLPDTQAGRQGRWGWVFVSFEGCLICQGRVQAACWLAIPVSAVKGRRGADLTTV